VLFLVNRRTLVNDMVERLERLGLTVGIVMGSDTRDTTADVLVASIDTLQRREVPRAELVFIDEAHFAVSKIWKKVLEGFTDAKIIGMTATPIRLDGRGMNELFEEMVVGPTVKDLVRDGYLVPTRTFAPATPDVTNVKVQAGDYQVNQLAEIMDRVELTGDIVEHWIRLGMGRPTVVFAVNCTHGEHIRDSFLAAGISSRFVSAETPDSVRLDTWRGLADGTLAVVVSVGIISYGWDCPPVSCCILARPTKSMGLHLQQIGRILRPAVGKTESLILDHAGNTLRHGFCDEVRAWTLEGRPKRVKVDMPAENLPRVCPECFRVWMARTRVCSCGYVFSTPQTVKVASGELVELTSRDPLLMQATGDPALQNLILTAQARNYKRGWIYYRQRDLNLARAEYASKFGVRPDPRWAEYTIKRKLL
jgi:superfamily II DNA or RNA helicase